jgi:protoporphyrinogen oxidase
VWSKHTRIGTNAHFRYPVDPGGYGSIAQALARRGGDVHLGHRAVRVDTARRAIHFANGAVARYETLISTIPLPELVALCPSAPAAVREAASRLRTNSIFVVNFGVDRADLSERHWVHFPEKDISFFRISYPHNFNPAVVPAGTSSVSAEVAYSASDPIDEAATVGRVRDDLTRIGILRPSDRIVATTTRNIKYAYCIYDQHRREALRVIHQWLRDQSIAPCGRYGLWTYFWSDEAVLSGLKAGELVRRRAAKPVPPQAVS